MTVVDPISDMFTRIRNAINVNFESVSFQYSNIKCEIAKVLTNEGFINGYEIINEDIKKKKIKIALKYDADGEALIQSIKRVSKPSKRIYKSKKEIYKVLNGIGILILSTSKGILTGKNARIKNVGGEVIAEVY
jgi:small subunit ribosomal protein S8